MNGPSILLEIQKTVNFLLEANYVLTEDMDLHSLPEWDSLNHMRLILELERIYKVDFYDIESTMNIKDIIKFIESDGL